MGQRGSDSFLDEYGEVNMFWLAGQLIGLILVVAGILLLAGLVVAGLFAAAAAGCIALFVLAAFFDGLYSLLTWEWDEFAAVKWLDSAMSKP